MGFFLTTIRIFLLAHSNVFSAVKYMWPESHCLTIKVCNSIFFFNPGPQEPLYCKS